MVKLRESTKTEAVITYVMVGIFIAAIIVIMVLTLPDEPIVAAILAVGCLLILVRWHARVFGYHCPSCGNNFEASIKKDLFSFQGFGKDGGWRFIRCPSCRKFVKAHEMTKIG